MCLSRNHRELATGLASCLSDLGVFDSAEGRAVLVATSNSIVDSLPRPGKGADALTLSSHTDSAVWMLQLLGLVPKALLGQAGDTAFGCVNGPDHQQLKQLLPARGCSLSHV